MISPNYAERGPHIMTAGSLLTGLTPLVLPPGQQACPPHGNAIPDAAERAPRKLRAPGTENSVQQVTVLLGIVGDSA